MNLKKLDEDEKYAQEIKNRPPVFGYKFLRRNGFSLNRSFLYNINSPEWQELPCPGSFVSERGENLFCTQWDGTDEEGIIVRVLAKQNAAWRYLGYPYPAPSGVTTYEKIKIDKILTPEEAEDVVVRAMGENWNLTYDSYLNNVPIKYRTKRVCLQALKYGEGEFEFIPKEFFKDRKFCNDVIENVNKLKHSWVRDNEYFVWNYFSKDFFKNFYLGEWS